MKNQFHYFKKLDYFKREVDEDPYFALCSYKKFKAKINRATHLSQDLVRELLSGLEDLASEAQNSISGVCVGH